MSTMTVHPSGEVLQTAEQKRVADLIDPARSRVAYAISTFTETDKSIMAFEPIAKLSIDDRCVLQEWLDEVRTALSEALEEFDSVVADAKYGPDYDGVLEGVERLRESILWGLHDEPKSVAECGERIEDVLRKADYF